MKRAIRALAIAALIAASNLTPVAVRDVRAIDCTAVYCATLEIVPSNGTGTGHITSDPSGIDCTSTPTSLTGTCSYQFSWAHFIAGGIDVDLYIDADSHSYACVGLSCGNIDQTLVRTQHLNPGDNLDFFLVFNLGSKTTVSIRGAGGTGAGRVTTSPAGLNCRIAGGVASGTCSADYWYIGSSSSVTLHRTPDAGSFACASQHCSAPDQDYVSTLGLSPGGSAPDAQFWIAVPVEVTVTGSGTVTSTPSGISCPTTCSKWFAPDVPPDDSTSLTATPAAGWYLKDWTGTTCGATTGATCTFINGYSGATVGVVFARLATPAPSQGPAATPRPTPRPTATPRAGAGTPSAAPATTTPMDPGEGTQVPGSSDGAVDPGTVAPPEATLVAIAGTPAPAAATGDPSVATPDATPVDAPRTPAGIEVGVLLSIGVAGLLVLVLVGFALGRRAAARDRVER